MQDYKPIITPKQSCEGFIYNKERHSLFPWGEVSSLEEYQSCHTKKSIIPWMLVV